MPQAEDSWKGETMDIRVYSDADEAQLFKMLREEGGGWECYVAETAAGKYEKALRNSLTYVAYEGSVLCGYVRCRDDDGFGIYVYDLLVRRTFRGHGIGRQLVERVCADHPEVTVYVMSDVDQYYERQGYRRVGSVFEACCSVDASISRAR